MKLILISLLLIISGCSSASLKGEVTTVTVVRHAEKLRGKNPGLSPQGERRAVRLSKRFSTLEAVYSSGYKRTIETATPSAAKFNLVINSSIKPNEYMALKTDILSNHSGGNILVVGHSNTVPGFINSLFSSKRVNHILEDDFSNLFVIKIKNGEGVHFSRERY